MSDQTQHLKICPGCGASEDATRSECRSCGHDLTDVEIQPVGIQPVQTHTKPERGQGAIFVLRVFAWLNLAGGIIGAILVWITMGITKVQHGLYGLTTLKEMNPLGITLGFVLLFEGVIGCVLLLVISSMAENLIEIRKNTRPTNISSKNESSKKE